MDESTTPTVESKNHKGLNPPPRLEIACYALTLILGGVYLVYFAFAPDNRFVALTLALAFAAILDGVLLWLRVRLGLLIYLAIAFGMLGFAGFRYYTDGYATERLGLAVGALLMLAGFSSLAEDISTKRS